MALYFVYPLYVVGIPALLMTPPQAVDILQHCSYTFVNDPRVISFFSFKPHSTKAFGSRPRRQRARHRFRTPRGPIDQPCTLPASLPITTREHKGFRCGLEVDNAVNYWFLMGITPSFRWTELWVTWGQTAASVDKGQP